MIKETRIRLDWGELCALTCGAADGRKVLFLHGWLDNAASFLSTLAAVPPSWNCAALDMPGHGHSDHRPIGTAYHLIDAVSDVLNAADALGWEKFHLVGHSLGAGVATLLAGSFPQRVEKLVLIEGIGPFASPAQETPKRFAEHHVGVHALKQKRLPVYPNLEMAVRARMQAAPLPLAGAQQIVERGTKPTEGGFTWRSDSRLRLPTQRFTEEQVVAFLRAITAPTLCVIAENGLIAGFANWKQRAEEIPSVTVRLLPGQHHLHLESNRVAETLREWLGP